MRLLILLALAACGSAPRPTNAGLYCQLCDLFEPSTGKTPVAYATNTTFHASSGWDTTCSDGTYLTEGDPPGTCHPIPHDTKVFCDGVACTVRHNTAENWFEVTPTAPGTVHIHATLVAKDGRAPTEVTLAKYTIERPTLIAARCTRPPAANDSSTIVIVQLRSLDGVLLSGGGTVTLVVAGGAACEELPNVDPELDASSKLPERRFNCPAVGSLHVDAKGDDFTARAPVRCP